MSLRPRFQSSSDKNGASSNGSPDAGSGGASAAGGVPELRPSNKNVNSARLFVRRGGPVNPEGRYVLYWMQIHRRLYSNFALEYAVAWANLLNKPLLIYEGLRCDYPWASDRMHAFVLQGMAERRNECSRRGINYYAYAEEKSGAGKGLLEALCGDAALVIGDEFPAYIIPGHNRGLTGRLQDSNGPPFATIDANGMIPLGLTDKAPYSAYIFRKTLQKRFIECYAAPPESDPLAQLQGPAAGKVQIDAGIAERWPEAGRRLDDIPEFVASLPIDHSVSALSIQGTRAAALERLHSFVENDLLRYDDDRNHPDERAASGLSPWLHFGALSSFEVTELCLRHQPPGWDYAKLAYNNGSRGFFTGSEGKPSIEAFLDELLTWRETGYHFCHHEPRYDQYESLPDWARATLDQHRKDKRNKLYSPEQLEAAETGDEIWNASMRELRQTGRIHNYLRMLWGKKVIEWTESPELALERLIHLNNKYSIDGRNPNSYSGVFWCFGRFDRPWQEREIFGQIRYMTTAQARKKVRLNRYLERYGKERRLL